jgi:hypothetical protein
MAPDSEAERRASDVTERVTDGQPCEAFAINGRIMLGLRRPDAPGS